MHENVIRNRKRKIHFKMVLRKARDRTYAFKFPRYVEVGEFCRGVQTLTLLQTKLVVFATLFVSPQINKFFKLMPLNQIFCIQILVAKNVWSAQGQLLHQ